MNSREIKILNKVIRILSFTLLCFFLTKVSLAQKGDYFLTHISPGTDKIDHVNFDIEQDKNGIICIANRNGILRYDGRNWELIRGDGAIFSIKTDSENNIYWAGKNGFGKLTRDTNFNLHFETWTDSLQPAENVFALEVSDGYLYALNESKIFITKYANPTDSFIIEEKEVGMLYGIFKVGTKLLVSTEKKGLMEITSQKLVPFKLLTLENESVIFLATSPDSSKYLIGTENNRLFLAEGASVRQLPIEDNGYIEGSEAVNAEWLDDNLIAIGTLKGGVVFLNPKNGKTEQIINYHTGLPDNEVFAMTKDRDAGLWVSHEYGFTRISPNLPFRSFSRFPGLEGNLLTAQVHQDRLYTSTSLGVYYLDKVKDFRDIIYYVKKQPTKPSENPKEKKGKGIFGFLKSQEASAENFDEATLQTVDKRGLFAFLRRKRSRKIKDKQVLNATTDNEKNIEQVLEGTQNPTMPKYETRIRRELKSVKYVYKPVNNINAKTTQLIPFQNKLLAAGLGGIFEINDTSSIKIFNKPIRYLYASANTQMIFGCTVENEVKVFELVGNDWVERFFIDDFKGDVQHISEDGKYFWFVGTDHIYKMSFSRDYKLDDLDVYEFKNPYFDESYSVFHEGKTYFINSSGYYYYDEEKDMLVPVDQENGGSLFIKPEKYLQSPNGKVWVHNGVNWKCIGGKGKSPDYLRLLNLFKDISYVTFDEQENSFWVVTGNTELYKCDDQPLSSLGSSYDLFLKEIRIPTKKIMPRKKFKIEQHESSLSFEFVQPDFSGIFDIQYKYKLEGLNETWSEWSPNNNVINFAYLPPGAYQLEVKTQNVFGQETAMEPVVFSVALPYWRQPWFYALEVILFGGLMFLSIRLNRSNQAKYSLISRLLAFLTLILIVEFIQTIAESRFETESSPVIDFFIQVSIAMMVLPLEGTLRKLFFRGKQPLPSQKALAKSLEKKKNTKAS